jgi:hypothetical protein
MSARHTHKTGLRRALLVFSLCVITLILFHKPLIIALCKKALSSGRPLCYASLEFEGSTLVLTELSAHSDAASLTVDRVEVELGIDWSHLCLRPRIHVMHPEVTLFSAVSSSESSLPLFYFSRWLIPDWNIQEGVLIAGSSRFYGCLEPSTTSSHFRLAYEPGSDGSPLISGSLERSQTQWRVTFQFEESHLNRLAPLIQDWGGVSGQLAMQGELQVDLEGHVHALHLYGHGESLSVRTLYCNRTEFALDFDDQHSGIDSLTVSVTLYDAGGEWENGLTLSGLNGHFSKTPHHPLALSVAGAGVYAGRSLAFSLEGEEHALLKATWAGHELIGAVAFSQQDSLFQAAFEGSLNADDLMLTAHFQGFEFQEATLHAPHMQAAHYAAFFPACSLSGELSLEALLSKEKIEFKMQPQHFAFGVDRFEWVLSDEGSPIRGTYAVSRRTLSCTVPLEDSLLTHKSSGIVTGVGSGCLHVFCEAPHWELKAELAHLNWGLLFPLSHGRCMFSLDSTSRVLCIDQAEATLSLLDAEELTVQAAPVKFDLNTQEGQFCFRLAQKKKEFAFLEGALALTQGSLFEIDLNPRSSHVLGTLLQCQQLCFDAASLRVALDMRPQIRAQDLHSIIAFLQQTRLLSASVNAHVIEQMHLQGALDLCLTSKHLKEGFSLAVAGREFRAYKQLYPNLKVLVHSRPGIWQIEELQLGPLSLEATIESQADLFSSSDLKGTWNAVSFKASGAFHAAKRTLACQIESARVDLCHLKEDLKGTLLSSFSVRGDFSDETLPWILEGEGSLYADLTAPLSVAASAKKTIRYTYSQESGLRAEQIDMHIKCKEVSSAPSAVRAASLVIAPSGNTRVEQLELSLSPGLIEQVLASRLAPSFCSDVRFEGGLQAEATARREGGSWAIEGRLKPGRYGFGEHLFAFEQFQFIYDQGACALRAKTFVGEHPLWGSLQFNLSSQPYGILKLFDHPKAEGLRVKFSSDAGGILLDSCEGSCHGFTCKLAKSARRKIPLASVLTGSVTFDAPRILSLCSAQTQQKLAPFKIGKGYAWQGDVVLWQEKQRGFLVTGALQGKECELLGYQLAQLDASVEATDKRLLLSNVKIADPAGRISVKRVECKKEIDAHWNLSIPQILVEQLQPSFLRKVDAPLGTVKPFVIERFALSAIRGQLDDLSSLQGEGSLVFSNQFKKEGSLFDLPLELIKRLGLDLGLLTPVCGSLQLELRGDRLYLMSLDNAYSEKELSSFYLAPSKQLSYIDLSGAIHIDLKMQQDVLLKIIEPFTLTIRGTLDKPRYGLQF